MTILHFWPGGHCKSPGSTKTSHSGKPALKHAPTLGRELQDHFLRQASRPESKQQSRKLSLDVLDKASVGEIIQTREGQTLVKHLKTNMVFKPDLSKTKLIPKLKLEDGFQGRRYQNGQGRIFTWNVEDNQTGPYTVLLKGQQIMPIAGIPIEVKVTFDHLGEDGTTEDLEIVSLPVSPEKHPH